jgi:DNA (cytosine-5)-methyltransferase 1
LEAGAFGVTQTRNREFIWAAAPGETLLNWPETMHIFPRPDLKITLPDSRFYAAAKSTSRFCSVTVKDKIGDLPLVDNGASKPTIQVYITLSLLYFLLLIFLISIRQSAQYTLFCAPVWK